MRRLLQVCLRHMLRSAKPPVTLPDREDDGTSVSGRESKDCADGEDVALYTIYGGGHTWPGGNDRSIAGKLLETVVGETSHDINPRDVMWDFFHVERMKQAGDKQRLTTYNLDDQITVNCLEK